MELVAALMPGHVDGRAWARQREEEGWWGVSLGDHVAPGGRPFPHLWVGLAELATSTSALGILSGFANNLYRSPVEFAQGALTLQAVSGGRFEAGLGAGWAAADSRSRGERFPPPTERARRYREAALVAADLLEHRSCRFRGEFYDIDVPDIGVPVEPAPPLVVAVGGAWVTRHVAPLAARVEVVPFAPVLRGGEIDAALWGHGRAHDVRVGVERAREANPDAPISLGVFVAAGRGTDVERIAALFGQGPSSGLAGEPSRVADTLRGYAELGVSRCTVCALTPGTLDELATVFFG